MFGSLMKFEGGLFDEFRRIEQEIDELLSRSSWPAGIRSVARGSYPAINVGATPEKVDVYMFAAGLDTKSLDLSVQKNLLTVSGERKVPANDTASYFRQERFSGEFRRVVSLPDDVDPDQVDATYRDGILHVSVKRREAAKARQIEIQ